MEPARRLSARWWPVEEEFQGSNILRVGEGAGGMEGRVEGMGGEDGCKDRRSKRGECSCAVNADKTPRLRAKVDGTRKSIVS